MARIPNNRLPNNPQKVVYVRRQGRRRRPTFRWSLLTVPLALLFAGWFLSQVVVSVSFDTIADAFRVHDRERFRELMMIGLLLVGCALASRFLRERSRGRD